MSVKICPFCKRKLNDIDSLSNHMEKYHSDEMPKNWSGRKYYFYSKHGRTTGTCVVCKGETPFNEKTGKPSRLCGKQSCHDIYVKSFQKNMMRVYNTTTLLNDPEQQKKMLANRKISGEYRWSKGNAIKTYTGSYEKDFLQMLDVLLDFDPSEVITPAPQVFHYRYEGEDKFYIPDAYLINFNLLVEIKDGGDNPNMHHKIQDVDKVKEKLKDQAVIHDGKYNYIKITNKQYGDFLSFIVNYRNSDEYKNPKDFKSTIILGEAVKNYTEKLSKQSPMYKGVFHGYSDIKYGCVVIDDTVYYNDMTGQLLHTSLSAVKDSDIDCIEEIDPNSYYRVKQFLDAAKYIKVGNLAQELDSYLNITKISITAHNVAEQKPLKETAEDKIDSPYTHDELIRLYTDERKYIINNVAPNDSFDLFNMIDRAYDEKSLNICKYVAEEVIKDVDAHILNLLTYKTLLNGYKGVYGLNGNDDDNMQDTRVISETAKIWIELKKMKAGDK